MTALARLDVLGELRWTPEPRRLAILHPPDRSAVVVVEEGPRVSRLLAPLLEDHATLRLAGVAHPPAHHEVLALHEPEVVVVDLDLRTPRGVAVLRDLRRGDRRPRRLGRRQVSSPRRQATATAAARSLTSSLA